MDAYEYSELLKSLTTKMENIRNIVKPDAIKARLEEIETLQQNPDFWSDAANAGKVSQEKTRLERVLEKYENAQAAIDDANDYFELSKSEGDEETLEMLYEDAESLKEKTEALEVQIMLSGDHDSNNAIVSIHPGAGGTESQDWASMLYRMYLRWAERHGFKVEELDYQAGDEAGIKDVSFIIKGENAYGYLKVENGIHRLVRISPFDSNAKRHTSFSSVMVSPEIEDDIDIEISVLSPMSPIDDWQKIELGKHGVWLVKNGRSGVFLPQVGLNPGWTLEYFLEELSSQKAGLPRNAYKDPETQLFIFTVVLFDEHEFGLK